MKNLIIYYFLSYLGFEFIINLFSFVEPGHLIFLTEIIQFFKLHLKKKLIGGG
jgi:hypothetical protein